MPHTPLPETATAAQITPGSLATNQDIERFLGECCDDTRRKILRHLGLPKRKKRPWAELWHAVGLATVQPKDVWDALTVGSTGRNTLWDAARVAEETGLATSTVNGYCHKNSFPDGFPRPLIDAGPKTRLWLPLEVRAYNVPSIYGARAALIRRRPKRSAASKKPATVPYTGTMQPLPPHDSNTA
ncbi:hypothetical protein [uncultured Paracoccus sp.]|uniref:hypothetical protein n=1 Tax=uncultured Paracoccus sp. TaxID=189685 RepID=UPI0025D795D0|nr:hypothetical protein [uncultured Paracoccus sp.]